MKKALVEASSDAESADRAKSDNDVARDERRKSFLRHVLAVRHQEKNGVLGGQAIKPTSTKAAKLYGAGEAHVSDILYFLTLCDVSGTPCSMGDVNSGAGVPRSSAHRLIAQLVTDDVIIKERAVKDRRYSNLRLAPSFRASFLGRIDAIMAETGFAYLNDSSASPASVGLSDNGIQMAAQECRAEYVDREIRDALNVISGFAELLIDPVMGLPVGSAHRAYADTILRAATRLNSDRESIAENLRADRVQSVFAGLRND